MTTIRKKIRWEMGHRLAKNYVGKCANLHGHSYIAEFALQARQLNEVDMVVDFSELSSMKRWIDHNLDHATMLWEGDGITIDTLASLGHKLFLLSRNPTAEAIASLLMLQAPLQSRVGDLVVAVTVWETESSCAYVEYGDGVSIPVTGALVPSTLEGG